MNHDPPKEDQEIEGPTCSKCLKSEVYILAQHEYCMDCVHDHFNQGTMEYADLFTKKTATKVKKHIFKGALGYGFARG